MARVARLPLVPLHLVLHLDRTCLVRDSDGLTARYDRRGIVSLCWRLVVHSCFFVRALEVLMRGVCPLVHHVGVARVASVAGVVLVALIQAETSSILVCQL